MTPAVYVIIPLEGKPQLQLAASTDGEARRLLAWIFPRRHELADQVQELLETAVDALERSS